MINVKFSLAYTSVLVALGSTALALSVSVLYYIAYYGSSVTELYLLSFENHASMRSIIEVTILQIAISLYLVPELVPLRSRFAQNTLLFEYSRAEQREEGKFFILTFFVPRILFKIFILREKDDKTKFINVELSTSESHES